jgi:hypothetical protein
MPDFIAVSPDGHGFIDSATGRSFVPMGANYFDPNSGWPPKIWSRYSRETINRQLGQLASVGLNCIRVFLDVKTLAPHERSYSDEGFAKVQDMTAIAARHGIRIIFSGSSCWEGPPDYWHGDEFADPRKLDLICDLWRELVERLGDNAAIMAWDLRNEPMVRFMSVRQELPRSATAPPPPPPQMRFALWREHARKYLRREVDDFPLYDRDPLPVMREYVRFLESLAENWVKQQCDAIRAAGARQLITVGNIQWAVPVHIHLNTNYAHFNPQRIGRWLDYASVHFYPQLRDPEPGIAPELAIQKLYVELVARGAAIAGKPLVIEEFGWKGGRKAPKDTRAFPEEEQTLWGDALMDATGKVASGWLNWACADSADPNTDISAATGLFTADERIKHWGRRFCEYARQFATAPPRYVPAKKVWALDRVAWLAEHNGKPPIAAIERMLAADPTDSLEIVFRD